MLSQFVAAVPGRLSGVYRVAPQAAGQGKAGILHQQLDDGDRQYVGTLLKYTLFYVLNGLGFINFILYFDRNQWIYR